LSWSSINCSLYLPPVRIYTPTLVYPYSVKFIWTSHHCQAGFLQQYINQDVQERSYDACFPSYVSTFMVRLARIVNNYVILLSISVHKFQQNIFWLC
jgi:hypothetical protein